MSSLHDKTIRQIFKKDAEILSTTKIPIVTLAGTYIEDLKNLHSLKHSQLPQDIVFSRAHFSMAYSALLSASKGSSNPDLSWMVDPTNYLSESNLTKIKNTQQIARMVARSPLLQVFKDLLDKFGRSRLPIFNSISEPLMFLFEKVDRPIISFHIATGNLLSQMGKTVIQVVTDPHVRDEYLKCASNENFYLCVFDEDTQIDALERANILNINLDPKRVVVTGPPLDQRIIRIGQTKKPPQAGKPLELLIATGGLGTNKQEIYRILSQLIPSLKSKHPPYSLTVYAGTQLDFTDMIERLSQKFGVRYVLIGSQEDKRKINPNLIKLIYHPQILDANELLINFGFSTAHGVITKPSGDMAYDAVGAGCFLLTLKAWGVWENHIGEFFKQKNIAREAQIDHISAQLETLSMRIDNNSWITQAMDSAKEQNLSFSQGTKKIIDLAKSLN